MKAKNVINFINGLVVVIDILTDMWIVFMIILCTYQALVNDVQPKPITILAILICLNLRLYERLRDLVKATREPQP